MIAELKSVFLIIVIFVQKTVDNLHRVFLGMPQLKRCQITAHLFLGSQYNKVGLKKLRKLGITAIVNMRIHSVYKKAQYQGLKYLHLPVVDNTPPPLDVLLKGAEFIDTEIKHGGIVYVHCRQGLGRGPTMALAYLIKTGITFTDALALIRHVRPFVNPRPEQIERLKELEAHYQHLHGKVL